MKFFYDAMKRAAGQEPAPSENDRDEKRAKTAAKQAMAAAPASTTSVASANLPMSAAAQHLLTNAHRHERVISVAHSHSAAAGVVEQREQQPLYVRARNTFNIGPTEKLVSVVQSPLIERNLAALEQCRVIRTRLLEVGRSRKLHRLLVTSSVQSEGKTLTSVNLAFSLSHLEKKRVLLIDADLRNPSVCGFLNVPAERGLGDYLAESCELEDTIWNVTDSLSVIAGSAVTSRHSELLNSRRMLDLLAAASLDFDYAIIDSPPLLPIADAQMLLPHVDGAILVARAGLTPYDSLAASSGILGDRLIGAIMNGVSARASKGYYSYGGYGR